MNKEETWYIKNSDGDFYFEDRYSNDYLEFPTEIEASNFIYVNLNRSTEWKPYKE